MSTGVLLYVQHLLGVGHLRRALLLAEAFEREGLATTLVCGGEWPPELEQPAFRRVQLPPIRASGGDFARLVDADGDPVGDAVRDRRRELLLATFAETRPQAVVLEAFPFGRRAFRFELDPLVAAIRAAAPRPFLLASIRDVLVAPADAARRYAIVDRVRADFDAVLVHGDPAFIPLEASFPPARLLADRLVYTGYVVAPAAPPLGPSDDAPEVLVSAGGGAVGARLLSTALDARRGGCLERRRWLLLAGPNLPEAEFAALGARLPRGVALERYRRDFRSLLAGCDVSVSQGGYNTVLEVLGAGAPAVIVPFSAGRETEQALRAERLAAGGAIELVPEAALSPATLAAAIERAAARPPAAVAVDTAGAGRSARLVAALIRSGSGRLVSASTGGIIAI